MELRVLFSGRTLIVAIAPKLSWVRHGLVDPDSRFCPSFTLRTLLYFLLFPAWLEQKARSADDIQRRGNDFDLRPERRSNRTVLYFYVLLYTSHSSRLAHTMCII